MKFKVFSIAASLAVMTLASCSDDNNSPSENPLSEKDAQFKEIAEQYLDCTVIPTYKNLSTYTDKLVEDLNNLRKDKTDANVRIACESFLQARSWWEMSEAFLFGPASDFGIDPHIDSWPLDRAGLEDEMRNQAHINAMAAEDGDAWAGSHLGPELLGFHGIEYIIFSGGEPKAAAQIPDDRLVYAIAIAGDLRNKCWQLELSWAGENNVSDNILEKVDGELEWPFTISGDSYKQNMLRASQAGSTYRTWTDAMQAIVDGCMDIADEVGTMKIGKPYSGEDVNYIESPYSHKSITDFRDNMVSIRNSYMGGIESKRDESKSLHAYISKANPALDAKCTAAIENAIARIEAMKAPFVENYNDPSAREAADACLELQEVLTEIKSQLGK